MIRWLPPEAALWRSMGNSWSTENEMQAVTVELLDTFIKLYVQAHSKPNSAKKYKPLRIPRPWDKSEKEAKRSTTLRELISKGVSVKKSNKGGDN